MLNIQRAVFVVQMMEMHAWSSTMLTRFSSYLSALEQVIDIMTGCLFPQFLRTGLRWFSFEPPLLIHLPSTSQAIIIVITPANLLAL